MLKLRGLLSLKGLMGGFVMQFARADENRLIFSALCTNPRMLGFYSA
jgi:hypothetical protein